MENYLTSSEFNTFVNGGQDPEANARNVAKIMSTKTNGIEGLPYQFPESVDRRIQNTEVGRKYADKIFGRLPLLFLTPCEPLFMDDFSEGNKNIVSSALAGLVDFSSDLITGKGRYYSVEFAYTKYYQYLNTMLTIVSSYMGLADERIVVAGSDKEQRISAISWQNETNSAFKTFFSSKENLIFYLDSFDSVSESFSNDTTESSLASQINGMTDQMNEIKFLFGKNGNAAADLMNRAGEVTSSIGSTFANSLGKLGGGIVESLANKGVDAVMNGGKIIFPEIWSNSDFSRSYSLEIKLRSPDHDNLSIFLNIIKPYCKLLCLTLPRQMDPKDPNSYYSPFLVRAYSKGMFNIEMGMITSLSVNKGATGCWNDDGLPTQLDITLDVKDLYSKMTISNAYETVTSSVTAVNNTAYMDFLANMAGLNVGQMEIGRRIVMSYYLGRDSVKKAANTVFTNFENSISNLMGKMYNTF